MYENIYLQIYVFLYTLYGGIIIGIIYDLIDVVISGNVIKRRSITDLLFWAVAFSIIIGMLFFVNNVTFRSYIIVGFALGWFVYFYTLSKLIRKLFKVIKNIGMMIGSRVIAILTILLFPIRKLLQKRQAVSIFFKKIINKIVEDFRKYKTYLFKR